MQTRKRAETQRPHVDQSSRARTTQAPATQCRTLLPSPGMAVGRHQRTISIGKNWPMKGHRFVHSHNQTRAVAPLVHRFRQLWPPGAEGLFWNRLQRTLHANHLVNAAYCDRAFEDPDDLGWGWPREPCQRVLVPVDQEVSRSSLRCAGKVSAGVVTEFCRECPGSVPVCST